LVNRIVGSNSKIGNFTILKFLFSHRRTKKFNRKPTIPTNPFSARLKIAITQKAMNYKTLACGWFHRIYPFETGQAIISHTRPEKDPDFLKNLRIVNLRCPILVFLSPQLSNNAGFLFVAAMNSNENTDILKPKGSVICVIIVLMIRINYYLNLNYC